MSRQQFEMKNEKKKGFLIFYSLPCAELCVSNFFRDFVAAVAVAASVASVAGAIVASVCQGWQ